MSLVSPEQQIEEVEVLPDFAYSLRPYANPEMIYKKVDTPVGEMTFIIDPWTQRWIIAREPTPAFLQLSDGCTRLTEIVRRMTADGQCERPENGFVGLAEEALATGLAFRSQAEHRAAGRPVYNACDPVGMHLEITNACNMTCTHCYVSSGRPLPNELNLEEIIRTIDFLPPFSGQRLAISGGEPAVSKDCEAILEHCAVTRGHGIDLYTNGKNFPKKLAKYIVDLNKRCLADVRVQISLEGATAEVSDMVRGPGSFDHVMKTLEYFKTLGLNRHTVLFVCLTKNNVDQFDDLVRLAERFDVAMLIFSQWQRQGNAGDTTWASIAPTVEQWVEAGQKILDYRNPRLSLYGNFFGDLNSTGTGRFSLDGPLFPKHTYFYNAFPRVTPQGEVFADQLWVDPDWILGNTKEKTFEECFNSPKFHQQLQEMRERKDKIPECKSCEWKSLCEGGSAGHTYAEHDSMDHKDWFCESRIYWFNRFVDNQVAKLAESAD